MLQIARGVLFRFRQIQLRSHSWRHSGSQTTGKMEPSRMMSGFNYSSRLFHCWVGGFFFFLNLVKARSVSNNRRRSSVFHWVWLGLTDVLSHLGAKKGNSIMTMYSDSRTELWKTESEEINNLAETSSKQWQVIHNGLKCQTKPLFMYTVHLKPAVGTWMRAHLESYTSIASGL